MGTLISVENVTFEYESENGGKNVLDNFSVSFNEGEFTAVLGHNGSGKSTLAKLLNGLLKPQSGKVTVLGMDTSDDASGIEIKKTVGMVFQNPDNQLVATVVDEDVAFGLENLGIKHDEMVHRVDAALAAVGMSEFAKSAPHNLSGGQKQRVAIAGIIAMEPKCIVFDEPTAMLDPKGRKEVLAVIKTLCREKGISVIMITHYMDEAAMADRIIVLNKGRITADGTPVNVFNDTEVIRAAGLDVPQSLQFIQKLVNEGFAVSCGGFDADSCADGVISYLKGVR